MRHFFLLAIVALAQLASCAHRTPTSTPQATSNMTTSASNLEQQLASRHFGAYFYYPAYTQTLQTIWEAQGEDVRAVVGLIQNKEANVLSRLIASEVLFEQDLLLVEEAGMDNVARAPKATTC